MEAAQTYDNPFLPPQGTLSTTNQHLDPHAQSLPVKDAHFDGNAADYDDDHRSEMHSVASDFTMNRQFFKTGAGDDLASMQSTMLQSIRKVRVVGKKKGRNVTQMVSSGSKLSHISQQSKRESVKVVSQIAEETKVEPIEPIVAAQTVEEVIESKPQQEEEVVIDHFQEYQHVYKIIMIGSSFTGKTSLIHRFVTDSFNISYMTTVGVDLKSVTLAIQDTLARVNIWDTTGQEKFKSLTKAYFRNCHGAVAVFDLTKRDTFYSLESSYKVQTESSNILLGQAITWGNRRLNWKIERLQFASELKTTQTFPHKGSDLCNSSIYISMSRISQGHLGQELAAYSIILQIPRMALFEYQGIYIFQFRMNCPLEAQDNIVLVGNKLDLQDQRQIFTDEAHDMCRRLNLCGYFETSANSNINVDMFFYTVALGAFHIEQQIKTEQKLHQDNFFTKINSPAEGTVKQQSGAKSKSNVIVLDKPKGKKKGKQSGCKC